MDDPGIVAYSGPRSGFLREMGKLAPTEFDAWRALGKVVAREGGTIPRRYRELIALGVGFTTERPYCIEAHVKGAKTAGASGEEITEAALIAAALRAGGAASRCNGTEVLRKRNDTRPRSPRTRSLLGASGTMIRVTGIRVIGIGAVQGCACNHQARHFIQV
jgi:AhpD family alkylhydroperoxidase